MSEGVEAMDFEAVADSGKLVGSDVTPAVTEGSPVSAGDRRELLIHEGDVAADYLEHLLDILDVDGDIDLDVENDRAMVAIVGSGLHNLVGSEGRTLDALQDLTRLAVAEQTGVRSRLMLDIGGFRQARRVELTALAREVADRVRQTGIAEELASMNPFERKIVHDAVADLDDVSSESTGEEPHRRVVIAPEA